MVLSGVRAGLVCGVDDSLLVLVLRDEALWEATEVTCGVRGDDACRPMEDVLRAFLAELEADKTSSDENEMTDWFSDVDSTSMSGCFLRKKSVSFLLGRVSTIFLGMVMRVKLEKTRGWVLRKKGNAETSISPIT